MRIMQQAFRVYCAPDDLDRTIAFYEQAPQTTCERRVEIRETGVTAAKVGGFLILRRATTASRPCSDLLFDSLDEFVAWLDESGAERLKGPRAITGGRNATIRHGDGLVVEYFEPAPAGNRTGSAESSRGQETATRST